MPVFAPARCRACSTALPDDVPDSALCADCTELPQCEECELPDDDLHATVAGDSRCGDCLTDWVVCEGCSRYTERLANTTTEGGEVCGGCARGYELCDNCDQLDDDSWTLDTGEPVCHRCVSNYSECDYCYALMAEQDAGCRSCGRTHGSDGRVHDYYYKPDPRFHGRGPVFLGLELEVKTLPIALEPCIGLAIDRLQGLGYLKDDSSIGCGFEIVTHPMDYSYAIEQFPWALLGDLDRAGAYTDHRVGLHVHVSRAGFSSPAHAYRWLKLLYRNQGPATVLARRDPSEWATFNTYTRARAAHIVKGERGFGRFQAINAEPADTFEVRIFASSLHPQQVQAALGFVAASVEYTRTLTSGEVIRHRGWEWTAFTAWLRSQPTYAPLLTELENLECAS